MPCALEVGLKSFQLDDNSILNKKINSVAKINLYSVIKHGESDLSLNPQATFA